MDIKKRIETAIELASSNLVVYRERFNDAKIALRKQEEIEGAPVKVLINEYLDSELKDVNGNTIREGYVIAKNLTGYPAYKVVNRGMQFIFGTPMYNPSVEVLVYNAFKRATIGKRLKSLGKSELSEFVIVFDDNK